MTGKSSPDNTFQTGSPTRQLQPSDFPFHKLVSPDNRYAPVLSDSNDVVGSQGVSNSRFGGLAVKSGAVSEKDTFVKDKIFTDGSSNLRRVTPRNTPSVINAVPAPFASKASPARRAPARSLTAMPVNPSASVSLGTT